MQTFKTADEAYAAGRLDGAAIFANPAAKGRKGAATLLMSNARLTVEEAVALLQGMPGKGHAAAKAMAERGDAHKDGITEHVKRLLG